MKYKISIQFDVDTDVYYDVPPTIKGVRDLVDDMIDRQADLPDRKDMTIVAVPIT